MLVTRDSMASGALSAWARPLRAAILEERYLLSAATSSAGDGYWRGWRGRCRWARRSATSWDARPG